MRKRGRRTHPLIWVLSVLIVASMICGLLVVALPPRPSTPPATVPPLPADTPTPVPEPGGEPEPAPAPTAPPGT